MATIGSKWSLVPKNGWNKVEQGWNGIGGIRTDNFDHFATPLMAILGPEEVKKWVQMGLYCYCLVQIVSGAHKWLEQVGTRLERDRGH